ncbi:MAG TPA: hypothetical protein V6D17_20865 [Candidatus Obscuribacterales bacterium]
MSTDPFITSNDDQFRKKASRRRDLAKLPIEEKLRRLVKLQAVAYTIGQRAGRDCHPPWGKKERGHIQFEP